ncbi:hypothetical protein GCM10029964_075490 [Kibdelosporangium lantanae]
MSAGSRGARTGRTSPSPSRPGEAGDLGDVVVLDPGEVPDEPGDRVGVLVDAERELFRGESVDGLVDYFTHPVECVNKQLRAGH